MQMKTKALPAVIMLCAGFVTCIISLFQHWELFHFTLTLLIVLIVFYLVGAVLRIVLDKAMDYFDEVVVLDDDEDYFEALEREQAMKALLESEGED